MDHRVGVDICAMFFEISVSLYIHLKYMLKNSRPNPNSAFPRHIYAKRYPICSSLIASFPPLSMPVISNAWFALTLCKCCF